MIQNTRFFKLINTPTQNVIPCCIKNINIKYLFLIYFVNQILRTYKFVDIIEITVPKNKTSNLELHF